MHLLTGRVTLIRTCPTHRGHDDCGACAERHHCAMGVLRHPRRSASPHSDHRTEWMKRLDFLFLFDDKTKIQCRGPFRIGSCPTSLTSQGPTSRVPAPELKLLSLCSELASSSGPNDTDCEMRAQHATHAYSRCFCCLGFGILISTRLFGYTTQHAESPTSRGRQRAGRATLQV